MKKYLMTGVAALALCAGFTSCSHNEDFEPITQDQIDKAKYDQAFLAYVGGKIASNQDWGFSATPAASRFTRANAVIQGDPFTFEETDGYYKSEIPSTAKLLSDYARADWGGKIDENELQKATELSLPEGTYSIHLWERSRDIYISGEVTLNITNNNSINQARIYMLPGSTLNFNMDNYVNNLEIYVNTNATLNYNAEKLYKQDGGGKIYNRGTVNFQNNFEANQDAIVYNEGTINGVNFTSKPGDGHQSFVYNFGDMILKGKMELNSCTNFYNEGNINVTNETSVTQANIWWINKGHYTTNSMIFSAKNSTFYNYCQLLVKGNAHMYDGEFNLMDNSYTEAATAEMDNFIVNMGSNTGINIKGAVDIKAQGDGTYQGFKTNGSNTYILIGGKVTVASHRNTLSISSGITYSINQIEIIKDGKVVTEAELQSKNDGDYPVLDLNGTNCPFGKLTVTPKTNDCGATWTVEEDEIVYDLRIWAEDLSAQEAGDFDFNDIVLDVKYDKNNATLCLRAAGGTLPLYIDGKTEWEVHKLFQVGEKVMVNTAPGKHKEHAPVVFKLGRGITNAAEANGIKLIVEKNGILQEMKAPKGEPSCKLAVDKDLDWLNERSSIKGTYEKFVPWANENNPELSKWWE